MRTIVLNELSNTHMGDARATARSAAWAGFALIGLGPISAGQVRAAEITIVQLSVFDDLKNLSIDVDTGLRPAS